MGAAHARSHTQWNGRIMLNINGVNIEYQYDGAHDARPTEHTLHGLDGLNLSAIFLSDVRNEHLLPKAVSLK